MQNEISYIQNQNENEPDAASARSAQRSPATETQEPLRPSIKRIPAKKRSQPESAQLLEPELALFYLIADPQTIAGVPSNLEPTSAGGFDEEVDRLRQALHAREQELEDLRRRADPVESEAAQTAPVHAGVIPTAPAPATVPAAKEEERFAEDPHPAAKDLLDSTQAHRMAKDARQSEQASRVALQAAQQAQRTEKSDEWPSPNDRIAIEQSWQTRPLSVQKHLLETAPVVAEMNGLRPTHPRGPKAKPRRLAPQAAERSIPAGFQLRAARAEVRELEATLSIARDTALTQKLEIARLRSEIEEPADRDAVEMAALEEAFRAVLPEEETIDVEAIRIEAQNQLRTELMQETAAAHQEIERLRERVSLGEREMEAREAERRILRETLAAREDELQTASGELTQLTQRLQEESKLIQELHASLDDEREHNAGAQSLLAQLRDTLQRVPGEAKMPVQRHDTARPPLAHTKAGTAAGTTVIEVDSGLPSSPTAFLSESPERFADTELAPRRESPGEAAPADSGRLFEAWQDDQVRRHFGPFGIDTTRDLVMAPLARRNSTLENPAKILVLGSGAEKWTELLAEDLIASDSPPFQILLGGDGTSRRRADLRDRPIDEFIAATRTPESPADFEALLAETRPSVIVSRNFLSGMSDVEPWLDVLRNLPRMGPGLILLESTGVGPVSPVDAMNELGDRIWSLMPARYTREGEHSEARIKSWHDAFQRMQPVPSNGLRAALREGFDLEISAQFGFLTEPFLRSPIAENFDPEAQRDRRFLHQIADVDDRKIEAGIAPALHFVARIDGRIED